MIMLIVIVYILIGYIYALCRDFTDLLDDLPSIGNPLWKPFLIFFWPIAIVLVGVFSFKNYIEEVIEYYKEKKNKEN